MKPRKMKAEEATAYQFLCSHYGTNVVYEPDGNMPPDFLVDGQYAVEVRRLNQNFFQQNDQVGLETLRYSLWSAIEEVCESFGKEYCDSTYGVDVSYRRPIPGDHVKTVKDMIAKALCGYLETHAGQERFFKLDPNLSLSVFPLSPVKGCVFRMVGLLDLDRGGFVVPLYLDNLAHCIAEKSSKIEKCRSCYPHWWLLLVDHVGWGLDASATNLLVHEVTELGSFDRVMIIDRSGQRLLAEFMRQ